jgi:hypothetical protein
MKVIVQLDRLQKSNRLGLNLTQQMRSIITKLSSTYQLNQEQERRERLTRAPTAMGPPPTQAQQAQIERVKQQHREAQEEAAALEATRMSDAREAQRRREDPEYARIMLESEARNAEQARLDEISANERTASIMLNKANNDIEKEAEEDNFQEDLENLFLTEYDDGTFKIENPTKNKIDELLQRVAERDFSIYRDALAVEKNETYIFLSDEDKDEVNRNTRELRTTQMRQWVANKTTTLNPDEIYKGRKARKTRRKSRDLILHKLRRERMDLNLKYRLMRLSLRVKLSPDEVTEFVNGTVAEDHTLYEWDEYTKNERWPSKEASAVFKAADGTMRRNQI